MGGDDRRFPNGMGVPMNEPSPKIDREAPRNSLQAEFDRLVEPTAEAIDRARPGKIIADSEEPVRKLHEEFRRRAYEQAIQQAGDAAEAAFSPSEGRERQDPRP